METIYFENENDFIKSSADYILERALSNIARKDFFTISLTGGSTPPKIYELLTKRPYKEKFPWAKTYFFLGDERILPPKNPESNTFMLNQSFFSRVDIPDENKILPDTTLGKPQDIAEDYNHKIKNFFKHNNPRFDLFLLGMGIDCHTASLFPNDNAWKNNTNLVISTSKPSGEPKVYRVSMGLPLINQSNNILMLISGQAKREVVNELLKNMSEGKNPTNSPIPEIKNSGEFIWYIN